MLACKRYRLWLDAGFARPVSFDLPRRCNAMLRAESHSSQGLYEWGNVGGADVFQVEPARWSAPGRGSGVLYATFVGSPVALCPPCFLVVLWTAGRSRRYRVVCARD